MVNETHIFPISGLRGIPLSLGSGWLFRIAKTHMLSHSRMLFWKLDAEKGTLCKKKVYTVKITHIPKLSRSSYWNARMYRHSRCFEDGRSRSTPSPTCRCWSIGFSRPSFKSRKNWSAP